LISQQNAGSGSISITVLDVGHGSCAIVSDNATTVLIDAGPSNAVLEYLTREGIEKINTVVISHSDADHIRGLVALMSSDTVEVSEILLNSDALKGSALWRSLAYEIDDRVRLGELKFEAQLREGQVIAESDEGFRVSVLAPRDRLVMTGPGATDTAGRRITSNSMSAVVLVSFGRRRIMLLTGDLDETGWEHLADTGQDVRAEVLVFPHHGGLAGGSGNTLFEFARRLSSAVNPEAVVFSLGRSARYATPRPEVIAGVRAAVPTARIACTELSEACAGAAPEVAARHLLPLYASGYRARACCAGTMRIVVTGDGTLNPSEDAHARFISEHAPNALCRIIAASV
jgi:beta-lactamase superfamily II metal-dependent hydrolase